MSSLMSTGYHRKLCSFTVCLKDTMWKTATSGEIARFAVLGNTLVVVCEYYLPKREWNAA